MFEKDYEEMNYHVLLNMSSGDPKAAWKKMAVYRKFWVQRVQAENILKQMEKNSVLVSEHRDKDSYDRLSGSNRYLEYLIQ